MTSRVTYWQKPFQSLGFSLEELRAELSNRIKPCCALNLGAETLKPKLQQHWSFCSYLIGDRGVGPEIWYHWGSGSRVLRDIVRVWGSCSRGVGSICVFGIAFRVLQ